MNDKPLSECPDCCESFLRKLISVVEINVIGGCGWPDSVYAAGACTDRTTD